MRRARTWGWRRTRRYDDSSNELGPSSSRQSYPAYIINTRGYDFREGQLLQQASAALFTRQVHLALFMDGKLDAGSVRAHEQCPAVATICPYIVAARAQAEGVRAGLRKML